MDEYIERETALREAESRIMWGASAAAVYESIRDVPAADVAPVRHGRWEKTADGAALCTACKRKMNPSQYGYAFCGSCGAKMDGGSDKV